MNVQNLTLFPMKKSTKQMNLINPTGQNKTSQIGHDQLILRNKIDFKGEINEYKCYDNEIDEEESDFNDCLTRINNNEDDVLKKAHQTWDDVHDTKYTKSWLDFRNSSTSSSPSKESTHQPGLEVLYKGAMNLALGYNGVSIQTGRIYADFAVKCYRDFTENKENNPLDYDFGSLCKKGYCIPVIFYTLHEMLKANVKNPMTLKDSEITEYLIKADKNIAPYIDAEINRQNELSEEVDGDYDDVDDEGDDDEGDDEMGSFPDSAEPFNLMKSKSTDS